MNTIFFNLCCRVRGSAYTKNIDGVAAIEFAFIAPILLLLFIGTLETSYAVSVDRKISRISSTVADLITQDNKYTKNEINDLLDVAIKIMEPYNQQAKNIKISITSLKIDNGQARVQWSLGYNGGSSPVKNSNYTVPNSIKENGTYLIAAKVDLNHKPAFSFIGYNDGRITFDDSTIALSEELFLRPRLTSGSITCDNC